MKKIIILILLLASLYNSYSSNKYKQYLDTNYFKYFELDKHNILYSSYMRKADFVDSLNGMICFSGNDGNYQMGLYKTTDGGTTWSMNYPIKVKISNDTTIADFQMPNTFFYIDKNNIVAQVSDRYYFDNLKEALLSYLISRDGGESWQINSFDICQGYDPFTINSAIVVSFPLDLLKNGYGIHPTLFGIYRTDNCFNNISLLMNSKDIVKKLADDSIPYAMEQYKEGVREDSAFWGNSSTSGEYNIWGYSSGNIKLFNSKMIISKNFFLGYPVHNDSLTIIYIRTDDEYKSFEYTMAPNYVSEGNMFSFTPCFLDWNTIWDMGYYKNTTDNLYHITVNHTTDFGKTWTQKLDYATAIYISQDLPTGYEEKTIFKNDSVGIVFSDYSRAYLTTDGGNTWKNLFKDFENTNTLNLTNAYFKDDDEILLLCQSCDDIITYKMHPDTNKPTSVEINTEINSSDYFYVVPPYPIPAKEIVRSTVYWDFGEDIGKADVSIYNYIGEIVSTKEKISINPIASYKEEIIWNCEDIPSGVYFINLKYNNLSRTIPIIISK